MKIRKAQLKRIIKEELSKVLNEMQGYTDPAEEKAIQQVLVQAQANSPDKALPVPAVKKQMERILGAEADMDSWVSRHEPIRLGSEEEGWVEITTAPGPHGVALWMNQKSSGGRIRDPESAAYGLAE